MIGEDIYLEDDDLNVLSKMPLFCGIEKSMIKELLKSLDCEEKTFNSKDIIWKAGSPCSQFGIVLEGSIQSVDPNRDEGQIIQRFSQGKSFGEAIAFGKHITWVDIVAAQDCRILFISAPKVIENKLNPSVSILTVNLLREISNKLSLITLKNQLISEPRVRNKLLMYLSTLPTDENGFKKIPFLQKDLAQYLNVNRYAFNREISRMKDEGIIEIQGQNIRVNKKND